MLNETQDPVGVYLNSLSALERAERAGARLAASMTDAATRTDGHDRGFAVEVAASRGPSVDAAEWPYGIEISRAIAAWHRARDETRDIWDRIPEDERQHLQPPP